MVQSSHLSERNCETRAVAMTKGRALSGSGDPVDTLSLATGTIGEALERRRRELGVGHDGAAEAIGISRSTYAAYERDLRRVSPEFLRSLAHFLEIGLVEVLELYGATCVAQARRTLLGDDTRIAPTALRGVGARRVARNDMATVERVYFDTAPEKVSTVTLATSDESLVRASLPSDATGRSHLEFGETHLGETKRREKKTKKTKKTKSVKEEGDSGLTELPEPVVPSKKAKKPESKSKAEKSKSKAKNSKKGKSKAAAMGHREKKRDKKRKKKGRR